MNFAGVITIRTRWSSQREKYLTAQQVASLCLSLKVTGVVVSWDSGGNDFIEVIRTIEACEKAGKSCGTQIANPDSKNISYFFDLGYNFLFMSEKMNFICGFLILDCFF